MENLTFVMSKLKHFKQIICPFSLKPNDFKSLSEQSRTSSLSLDKIDLFGITNLYDRNRS